MRYLSIVLPFFFALSANAANITSNFQVRLTVLETCSSNVTTGRISVYCQGGTQPLVSLEPALTSQNSQGLITVITY